MQLSSLVFPGIVQRYISSRQMSSATSRPDICPALHHVQTNVQRYIPSRQMSSATSRPAKCPALHPVQTDVQRYIPFSQMSSATSRPTKCPINMPGQTGLRLTMRTHTHTHTMLWMHHVKIYYAIRRQEKHVSCLLHTYICLIIFPCPLLTILGVSFNHCVDRWFQIPPPSKKKSYNALADLQSEVL